MDIARYVHAILIPLGAVMKKIIILSFLSLFLILNICESEWQNLDNGIPPDYPIWHIAIDSNNQNNILVSFLTTLYYSTNSGDSWSKCRNVSSGPITSLYIYNNYFFVGGGGFYVSSDYGQNWNERDTIHIRPDGLRDWIDSYGAMNYYDGNLYLGAHAGYLDFDLFKSSDYGITWQSIIRDTTINHIRYGNPIGGFIRSITKKDSLTIVGSVRGPLIAIRDESKFWEWKIINNSGGKSLSFIEDVNGNNIYGVIYKDSLENIYLSKDNCSTWVEIKPANKSRKMFSQLMSCGNNLYLLYADSGVYVSNDFGKTWRDINYNLNSIIDPTFTDFSTFYKMATNDKYMYIATLNGLWRAKLIDCEPDFSSIAEITPFNQTFLFPNPASDKLYLKGKPSAFPVRIFTPEGIKVLELKPPLSPFEKGENVEIDISGLAVGIYFVKVGNKVEKFVVIR